jgi:hypothetical protein
MVCVECRQRLEKERWGGGYVTDRERARRASSVESPRKKKHLECSLSSVTFPKFPYKPVHMKYLIRSFLDVPENNISTIACPKQEEDDHFRHGRKERKKETLI